MNDKWARIIGIPLVGLIMAMFFDLKEMALLDESSLWHWLTSTVHTLVLWEGNRQIFIQMRRRLPGYYKTGERIFYQTLVSIGFTFIASTGILFVESHTSSSCMFDVQTIFVKFIFCLIPTFFVTLIYESVYFFGEWKKNIQRIEALAKENLRSQFESLKNQLDPHFLFNSLNTLAALIDEENKPAQKYLEQLSDVYRYVLLNREKNTVPLSEEMAFLESYVYLNKTRFRENLRIENTLFSDCYDCQVAPLSLQMLVENAIKHNVVSKDKPLTIRLYNEELDYVVIENNKQEKTVFEKSTKVGLQNIINRYKLLTDQPVEIVNEPDAFAVRIPLLASSSQPRLVHSRQSIAGGQILGSIN